MTTNKNAKAALTQDALHQLIDYNPETGSFTWAENCQGLWKSNRRGQMKPGNPVKFTHHSTGYQQVRLGIFGSQLAHRLAWMHETGRFPPKGVVIDHENGLKTDNRYENLRIASRSQNNHHARRRCVTKLGLPRGVCIISGKPRARLVKDQKYYYGSVRETVEQAANDYMRMKSDMIGRDFVGFD